MEAIRIVSRLHALFWPLPGDCPFPYKLYMLSTLSPPASLPSPPA